MVMVLTGGARTNGDKTTKPNKQGKGSKRKQRKKPPSNLLLVLREANCEELPSVASSAGGDKKVGKWDA